MGRSGRPTPEVVLSVEERETLECWARRPNSAQALVLRCRIVLAAADGEFNKDIADRQAMAHVSSGQAIRVRHRVPLSLRNVADGARLRCDSSSGPPGPTDSRVSETVRGIASAE